MRRRIRFAIFLLSVLFVLIGCGHEYPVCPVNATTEASGYLEELPGSTVQSGGEVAAENTTPPVTAPSEAASGGEDFPEDGELELYTHIRVTDMEINRYILQATGLRVIADYPDPDGIKGALPTWSLVLVEDIDTANSGGTYGITVNLMEYRELMPNLFGLLEAAEYADYRAAYMHGEEALYVAPVFLNGSTEHSAWIYREDVFRELGLQPPVDWESLCRVLKALKEAYPESYPFTLYGSGYHGLSALADFAQQFGVDYSPEGLSVGENGALYDPAVTEQMRTMLEKLRYLMEEGLMDPLWMAQDESAYQKALAEGRSFLTHGRVSLLDSLEAAGVNENGEFALSWFLNIPLEDSELPFSTRRMPVKQFGWAIDARFCPDVELAVRYLDWMYSEEGILVTSWGQEGRSYGVGDGGEKYYLESFAADGENKILLANPLLSGYIDFEAVLADYSEKNRELILTAMESARTGGLAYREENAAAVAEGYLDRRVEYIIRFIAGDLDIRNDDQWQQMVDFLTGYTA